MEWELPPVELQRVQIPPPRIQQLPDPNDPKLGEKLLQMEKERLKDPSIKLISSYSLPGKIPQADLAKSNQQAQNSKGAIAVKSSINLDPKNFGNVKSDEFRNYDSVTVKTNKGSEEWLIGKNEAKGFAIKRDNMSQSFKLTNAEQIQKETQQIQKNLQEKQQPNGSMKIDSKNLKYKGVIGNGNNKYAVFHDSKDPDAKKTYIGISGQSKDSNGNLGWAYKEGDKTTSKIENSKDIYNHFDDKKQIPIDKFLTMIRGDDKDKFAFDLGMADIKADPKMAEALKIQKSLNFLGKVAEGSAGLVIDEKSAKQIFNPDLENPKVLKSAKDAIDGLFAGSPEQAIAKLVLADNPDVRALGDAMYRLSKQELRPYEADRYLKRMDNVINNAKFANKPEIQRFATYLQDLRDSGRAMNQYDANLFRKFLSGYR